MIIYVFYSCVVSCCYQFTRKKWTQVLHAAVAYRSGYCASNEQPETKMLPAETGLKINEYPPVGCRGIGALSRTSSTFLVGKYELVTVSFVCLCTKIRKMPSPRMAHILTFPLVIQLYEFRFFAIYPHVKFLVLGVSACPSGYNVPPFASRVECHCFLDITVSVSSFRRITSGFVRFR